jgi:hypothetical protein
LRFRLLLLAFQILLPAAPLDDLVELLSHRVGEALGFPTQAIKRNH